MRIAIVKLSALGDIVYAMVVLQFIKKFNHNISIDWIVEERFKEVLEFNPDINEIHTINLKKAKYKKSLSLFNRDLQKLKKLAPYDLVIDMQGLIKSAVVSKVIPSKSIVGFDKFSAREGLASFLYNKTFNIGYSENIIKRNLRLLEFAIKMPFLIEQLESKLPYIFSSRKYESSDISNSKKNVVIITGASHSSKIYPSAKLAKLTKMLDANFIIIWGNKDEKNIANEIKVISPKVNVSNKLSLDILISLIGRVDLVIGADTGPTHLAWALNIPSITLFGSTPGYRNTLASEKNLIIESKSKVNPNKIDKNDFSIRDIKVEEILNAAQQILNP